jgi:hypothetical protein
VRRAGPGSGRAALLSFDPAVKVRTRASQCTLFSGRVDTIVWACSRMGAGRANVSPPTAEPQKKSVGQGRVEERVER